MRYLAWVVGVSMVLLAGITTLRFVGSHYFGARQSGVYGLEVNAPVDILFIGSSHTRQTYDARLIEEKTGKKVFLVAYGGVDPVTMVPMLEHMLAAKNKPKLVVVEAYSAMFGRVHAIDDARIFFESPPQLKAKLLREFVGPAQSKTKLLDAFELLVNRNNEFIVAYPLNRMLLSNVSYHGAYQDKFVPGLTPEQFRVLKVPLKGKLGVNPEQRAAFVRILHIASEANVPVVFVESPLPRTVADLPVMRGLKESMQQVLAEENVAYFDGDKDFPLDDPTLFADSNHLSTKGRVLFSEQVAEWLLPRLK